LTVAGPVKIALDADGTRNRDRWSLLKIFGLAMLTGFCRPIHPRQVSRLDPMLCAFPRGALRSLLAMGLVVCSRHPGDKRKYVMSLTEKGRGLEPAALQAAIDATEQHSKACRPLMLGSA